MKKSVAMKWIKALRSGKYKQGEGQLKLGKNFCCLGVLCDISKQGKYKGIKFYPTKDRGSFDAVLPEQVKKWAGMKTTDGEITLDGVSWTRTSLADLNDGSLSARSLLPAFESSLSFDEIADIIQMTYEEL